MESVGSSQLERSSAADHIIFEGVENQRLPAQTEILRDEQDPIDAKLDTLQADSRVVRLNLSFDESRRAEIEFLELFISSDHGKTWILAAANTPDRSQFDHIVPDDGTYWFGLRVTYRNGIVSPRSLSRIVPAMKVRVTTEFSDFVGGLGGAVLEL